MRALLPRSVGVCIAMAVFAACQAAASTSAMPDAAASEVRITTAGETVVLTPAAVPAGLVSFRVEHDGDATGHAGWDFVSRSDGPCDGICLPQPMTAADVELLRTDSAPPGFGYDSGWGAGIELTLAPGLYVFMVPGPNGAVPGAPPASVTVLTVQ